jgi:hypothetical protein
MMADRIGISLGLNAHQLQISAVGETDQRHLRSVVAVRAAIDTGDPDTTESTLEFREIAACNGHVINVRVGGKKERAEKKNAAGDASGGVEFKLRRRTWQSRHSTGPKSESEISERTERLDYICMITRIFISVKSQRF